ncbi:glycoprotein-N-acetylgalactosamine 3-beta-galactosyltransferase 1 [Rhipicephalus sanguineus]|uniref:glycoprotein-N-acetylgalactosamine 3-beta-galactosyltransferase 1 n=1 Tax=Rhipicephalus sanguineus TaxID=34632 RepID=UPI00189303AD|nr:glycoprotein-N-acetylgalactosamine 3-beta-galactosyltransferase 1 [Rhipicephalus sanguineus]
MHGLVRVAAFLVASVSGSLLAVIVLQYREILESSGPPVVLPQSPSYRKWLSDQGLGRAASGAVSEAGLLYERVPVLCLVRATSAQQARSVLNTWSRRCNRVLFFGSLSDPHVPVERVGDAATCALFARILAQHGGSFRWLLLVDDETFAVVENLRLYVAPLNASDVHYLGHPVRWGSGFYNALAAGIALSEGAVRALRNRCRPGELERMVATALPQPPVDTRDALLRGRFNMFAVEQLLLPGSVAYGHRRSSIFRSPEGGRCCSQHAITFHGVNPVDMFLLEYLVYGLHVGPGGGLSPTSSPPANVPMELTSLLKGKAFVKPYGITAS